jgi:hypothetical protein
LHALKPSQIPAFRKPRAKKAPSVSGPCHSPESKEDLQVVERLIAKIADYKRNLRGLQSALDRAHRELCEEFDRRGVEQLELSAGLLRRKQQRDGEGWDFYIEV